MWDWGSPGRLSKGVEVREVVRNEVDGLDGSWVHIDGHVLLHAHPLWPLPAHCCSARHGGSEEGRGLRQAPLDWI